MWLALWLTLYKISFGFSSCLCSIVEEGYELVIVEQTLISGQILLSISNALDYLNGLSERLSCMHFFLYFLHQGAKFILESCPNWKRQSQMIIIPIGLTFPSDKVIVSTNYQWYWDVCAPLDSHIKGLHYFTVSETLKWLIIDNDKRVEGFYSRWVT